jgi:putative effector of murein hydrolase LrgA (UPF0299 family)
MGVNVSELGASAFLVLLAVPVLIGVVYYMRRTGHLHSRRALMAVAIITGLLILFGMIGVMIPSS